MNSFSQATLVALLAATVSAAGSDNGDGASNCMDIVLVDNTDGTLSMCYWYENAQFHGDINYVSKVEMVYALNMGFCM